MPGIPALPPVSQDDAFQSVLQMLLDSHADWLATDTNVPLDLATKTPAAVAFYRAERAFTGFIDTLVARRAGSMQAT